MISQVYQPDHPAVGQYMHDAAAEFARRGHRVVVYCANRGYDDPSRRFPSRETLDGVEVRRLPFSSFGKRSIAVRLLGQVLFVAQAALRGLFVPRLRCVLVSTSPPMVGAAALFIRLFRRAPIMFWVMDLNVDQMIANGSIKPGSLAARVLRAIYGRTLRKSREIVVLDRFMQERIADSYGVTRNVHVLPPWPLGGYQATVPHAENFIRHRHGLDGKFVFMYSGNMGIGHPIGVLLEAARRLQDMPQVMFVFVGGGVRRGEVESAIRDRGATNLLLLPFQLPEELWFTQSAADVHLAAMDDSGVGYFHPCKVYGSMVVARPVLFAGPEPSHVTDLIDRYKLGWRIPAHDPAAVAKTMRGIAQLNGGELRAAGERARRAIDEDLSKPRLCGQFCDIVSQGLSTFTNRP
jgi:hypothetical protein